jgi:hypothetical protein
MLDLFFKKKRPDDDFVKVEICRLKNIYICNKNFLCFFYTLYELDKHIGMTKVKIKYQKF